MSDHESVLNALDVGPTRIVVIAEKLEDDWPATATAMHAMHTFVEAIDAIDHDQLFDQTWDISGWHMAVLLAAIDETRDRLVQLVSSTALDERRLPDPDQADTIHDGLALAREGLVAAARGITQPPAHNTGGS